MGSAHAQNTNAFIGLHLSSSETWNLKTLLQDEEHNAELRDK